MKIEVRNFQSLASTSIEVEGLTVVTGRNNRGKSGLIRAVFGAFSNSPASNYVRHGQDHLDVYVDFGGGENVRWTKGEKVNSYQISGKSFDKVGSKPPEEIHTLGVYPLQLSGKETLWPQFAHQLVGTVFLLDRPGSILAEAISDPHQVSILNEALRSCQTDQRSHVAEIKVREKDLTRYESEIRSYDGVENVSLETSRLRAAYGDISAKSMECSRMVSLSTKWDSLKALRDRISQIHEVDIPPVLDLQSSSATISRMAALKERWDKSNFVLDRLQDFVSRVSMVDIPSAPEIESHRRSLAKMESLSSSFLRAAQVISTLENASNTLDREIEQATLFEEECRSRIRKCPECGSVVTTQSGVLHAHT